MVKGSRHMGVSNSRVTFATSQTYQIFILAAINYFIKSDLLQMTEIGQYEQFWLGAYTTERHGQGKPGDWIWPHMNKTVEWADWADGEPNDYYGEQCVVMREYHNPFFPVARDYFWNDFDCQASAHYICESACSTY